MLPAGFIAEVGRRLGRKVGRGFALGHSPTRFQHAQPVRLDFGRLLVSGKGTVGPSGAGMWGPGPEQPWGSGRPLYQHLPPLHLSLCAPISGQGLSGRAVRSVLCSRSPTSAGRLSRSRSTPVYQSRRGDRGLPGSSAPCPCGPPDLSREGQDWLGADTDVPGPSCLLSLPAARAACRRGLDPGEG